MPDALYLASTWVIFVILAITLHEAAHAFVARFLGYDTASKLGRVNLNPFKHIDPVADDSPHSWASPAGAVSVPFRLHQTRAGEVCRPT